MYRAIQEDAPCWIEDVKGDRIVPFDTKEVIYNGCPTTMFYVTSRPNQVGYERISRSDHDQRSDPHYAHRTSPLPWTAQIT